ncbi:MAG: hypothetical protein ACFCVD_02065 [Nodosilinea sp.]
MAAQRFPHPPPPPAQGEKVWLYATTAPRPPTPETRQGVLATAPARPLAALACPGGVGRVP